MLHSGKAAQGEAGARLMTFFRQDGAVVLWTLLAGMVLAAALIVLRDHRPDGEGS